MKLDVVVDIVYCLWRRLVKYGVASFSILHKKNYIYNNVKYQDPDGYANTCGSHVVHRLYRLKNDGMDLQTYYNYMKISRTPLA
ncbi:MAG: hypothetical protein ACKPKO_35635 [Candidatus Fonsibacter sp.]